MNKCKEYCRLWFVFLLHYCRRLFLWSDAEEAEVKELINYSGVPET